MFRLSALLGLPVHEVESWPATELDEWRVFLAVWPLWVPSYFIAGQVCAVLVNLWSKRKYTPEDFVPGRPQETTPEEELAKFEQVVRMKESVDSWRQSAG
jgi:hypothetical protein